MRSRAAISAWPRSPRSRSARWSCKTNHFYYMVLAFFVLALIFQHRLVHSAFGMRIRAMKHSELGVASVGVDVYGLKVLVFVISAAFAGFGGTLFAHQQNYISPDNFPVLLLGVLPSCSPVRGCGNADGAGDRRHRPDVASRDAARFRQVPAHRLRHLHPADVVFPADGRHGSVRARRPAVATQCAD